MKGTLLALGLSVLTLLGVSATESEVSSHTLESDAAFTKWEEKWETIKNDWTQVSINLGRNITELNFAWYAPTDLKGIPIVKVSESPDMKGAMEFKGSSTPAVLGYTSNKVTITDLKEEMTYYYTYGQDEVWSDVTAFETRNG